MKKLLVLFNLQSGVDIHEYENWARNSDIPTVRGLSSVVSFNVYRAEGMYGSDGKPPYQYAEWLEVIGLEELGTDAQSEAMASIVQVFGTYADSPQFIVMNDI